MTTDTTPAIRVRIRWMIRRDLFPVMLIDDESFDSPWTDGAFLRVLRQRNCIGVVAEQGGQIVGFMIYALLRNSIHVLNFAVAADCRRLGVGRQMAANLIEKLSAQRRSRITLEVRETNLAAQLFFCECGFRAVNVLRGWFDNGEDAYRMVLRVGRDSGLACKREAVR